MAPIHPTDVPGWADELSQHTTHVLTKHSAIASLAIIVLLVLIAQLLPRFRGPDIEDDHL